MKRNPIIYNSRRTYSKKYFALHPYLQRDEVSVAETLTKAVISVWDTQYYIEAQLCREGGLIPLLQGIYGTMLEGFNVVA